MSLLWKNMFVECLVENTWEKTLGKQPIACGEYNACELKKLVQP
jgi:hypothetical protein